MRNATHNANNGEGKMANLEKIRAQQVVKCAADEKALAKCKKDYLQAEVKRHHKVVDLRGLGKWDLIGMILRAKYGVKVLSQVDGWN